MKNYMQAHLLMHTFCPTLAQSKIVRSRVNIDEIDEEEEEDINS